MYNKYEKKLKKSLYLGLIFGTIFYIALLSFLIWASIDSFNESIVLGILAIIICVIVFAVGIYYLIPGYLDLFTVNRVGIQKAVGTIARYKVEEFACEGASSSIKSPIIKTKMGNEIRMQTGIDKYDLQAGTEYTFLYLKYTKIAILYQEDSK